MAQGQSVKRGKNHPGNNVGDDRDDDRVEFFKFRKHGEIFPQN